jgi:UDP-glucuronate 4-epimerase
MASVLPHNVMATIFLTGAAGFIGSHTAHVLLERGDTVIGVDNLNTYYDVNLKHARLDRLKKFEHFHFFQADVADYDAINAILEKQPVDAICHLAAQAGVRYSIENPLAYVEANIKGTTVIFELARQHNITQVVYASSSSIYGSIKESPFREDMQTDTPISLYAASKKSCELIAHTYHHLFKIKTTGLRFFTVYGPWGRPDMAAFLFADAMRQGKPIKVFNYGKMHRDFTYIDDIVRGVVASLDTPLECEVLNLGGNHTTELEHFISVLEKELGYTAQKEYLPLQDGDVVSTSADISKAQKLLNWTPEIQVEEGLARFATWYREYYNVPKP